LNNYKVIEMNKDNLDPVEKITKARVQLISKSPFFGVLTMSLVFKEDKGELAMMPTMGVTPNGVCYFNPKFMDSLTTEECKTVICHEVLHVALMHLERQGTRDRIRSNMAADYAVNLILEKDFTMPKWSLLDHKYDGMSMEQIYDMLPKPKLCKEDCSKCPLTTGKAIPSPYGETMCKNGSFDRHITKDEMDEARGEGGGKPLTKEELQKRGLPGGLNEDTRKDVPNFRKILQDAYHYAKSMGKLPAGIERLMDDYSEPKLSWREILSQYITRSIPQNFSYRKPSRKSISSGYYFPSTEKEELSIWIVVDTSGSISEEELSDFLGEVLGLLRTYQKVEIKLWSCDAELYEVNEVTSEYDLKAAKLAGGGGTNFQPIFNYINKNQEEVKVLIYFTDTYGTFPEQKDIPIGMEVIWVVSKNGNMEGIPEYFPNRVQLK